MSMSNVKVIDQKEYLKKYLSGDKEKKKKKHKQKKHKKAAKVKIIDDDAHNSDNGEVDEELLLGGEDAPQIVGEYIEENPNEIRSKWRNIAVKEEEETAQETPTVRIKSEPRDADDEENRWGRKVSSFREKSPFTAIKIKQERRSPFSDQSPPKKRQYEDHSSPARRKRDKDRSRQSEDMNPPRRNRSGDSSPPRRIKEEDLSPPRRKRRDSDQSPPRRRRQSPPTKKIKEEDLSPPRRKRCDSDQSPPRRRRQSPPRRRRSSSDQSPPRRRKDSNLSPVRRKRLSTETSPTRNRQKRRSPDQSPPRRRRDSDQSPIRRKERHSDEIPPTKRSLRRRRSSDQSPPRKDRFTKEVKRSPSPRQPVRKSRWAKASPSLSPPPTHKPKNTRTLDGKKAGLQDAQSLKAETDERRRREHQLFEQMSSEVSGRDADIQIRSTGRRGRRAREAANEDPAVQKRKEEHERKKKELYDRWGRGLKQLEDHKSRQEEMAHEASKPVARYANDEDLDRHLREQEHADDPMLEYMRAKRKKLDKQAGKPEMPKYEGSFPENRFGIRPGYRWDGVDRSNGYEKRWFNKQNERVAIQDEAYKYSVEDM